MAWETVFFLGLVRTPREQLLKVALTWHVRHEKTEKLLEIYHRTRFE